MEISKLKKELTEAGFIRYDTEIGNVDVYMRKGHCLGIVDVDASYFNCMQAADYISGIKAMFGTEYVTLLVFTSELSRMREELGDMYGYWLYDRIGKRLVIYEDQPQDLPEVEKMFEDDTFDADTRPYHTSDAGVKARVMKARLSRYSVVNFALIAANIIVYIIVASGGNTYNGFYLAAKGGLVAKYVIDYKEYYRLFTSMFLHAGVQHLASNMIMLLFVGDTIERIVGHVRYAIIYLAGGLFASVGTLLYYRTYDMYACCIGASGAIFAVMGALIYILICNRGRTEGFSIVRIILFVAYAIYSGLTTQGTCNAAHIAGLLGGLLITAICYRKKGNTQ